MRWDSLTLTPESETPAGALPLSLPGAVVRTFDTPGFAGMTFYEIRAKSIISHVPAASRMPFEWTINPYRGCSHACVYCLAPDTPVLMLDGTSRPIGTLRPGDQILGTGPDGPDRRYVPTQVLAAWSTVKRAYRVTLDDGTEIVASADHRFLGDGGWVYVAGTTTSPGVAGSTPTAGFAGVAGGTTARPTLGAGDKLVGVGPFGARPGRAPDGLRSVVAVESLGFELRMCDITTGTGDFIASGVVSHNCFARNTHTYLDLDAGHDFDSKIVVKVNAPELLRKELAAARWGGAHIAMGTNVDCYQRAEGRYRLMPGIISALTEYANPFSILTKGTLIARDLDLLRRAATVTTVGVSFSVGFVDEATWRSVEPGTPSPSRRLDAVRQFAEAGLAPTVLMAPVLPGLTDTDESIDRTVAAIAAAGAAGVVPLTLHLRPGAREWYAAWLTRTRPDLVDRYREIYGSRSYAPKAYQREISARVATAARRHGLGRPRMSDHRRLSPEPDQPPREVAEQLTLL
jgi:DNA repair photolyase